MAIESRIINNSLTEIYINGGGNFITQAAPTNFHGFWNRRPLDSGESIADFREVTPKERQTLEAQDAAWVQPPQLFIDLWNAACGVWGRYNESTGFFELNGLTDITYAEAMRIYEAGWITTDSARGLYSLSEPIRTNIPSQSKYLNISGYSAYGIEIGHSDFNGITDVLNLTNKYGTQDSIFYVNRNGNSKINGYPFNASIKKIIGIVEIVNHDIPCEWFYFKNLSDLRIIANFNGPNKVLNLTRWDNISVSSIKFIIEHAKEVTDNGATIRINHNVYSKLTDETNTEWHSLLAQAAEKNITFTT